MAKKIRFRDPSIDAPSEYIQRYFRDLALSLLRISQGRINFDGMFHHKVLSVIADVTANDECVILADATAGSITVTLPDVESATDRTYYIKKTDASGNAVTVDGNASETIDGATTNVLSAQFDSIQVVSNGTEWFII